MKCVILQIAEYKYSRCPGFALALLLSTLIACFVIFSASLANAATDRELYQNGYEEYKNDRLHAANDASASNATSNPRADSQGSNSAPNSGYATNEASLSAEYDKAQQIYKDKNYSESFPMFINLCKNKNFKLACWDLANSYASGRGVQENPEKGLEICNEYLAQNDVRSSLLGDLFKCTKAVILLFKLNYSDQIMSEVFEIYKSLVDSKIKWVAEESRNTLSAIPIYLFLDNYLRNLGAFRKNLIDFKEFEKRMHGINTNDIPPDLRDKFFAMRNPCLKSAEINDESIVKRLGKSAVNGAIKGFLGGIFGAGEAAVEEISKGIEADNINNECKKRSRIFFDDIKKYQISNMWLNRKIDQLLPKNK